MTADLEARLLASLPSIDAFAGLGALGIDEGAFVHYRPMYQYIRDLVEEHSHLPRLLDLKATFNIPAWVDRKPEEYDWLLEEFQRIRLARQVQEIVEKDVEDYSDQPEAMLGALIKDLSAVNVGVNRFLSITDATATSRLQQYSQRVPTAGLIAGIPTGLSYFDVHKRVGWMPGELEGLVSRTYVGKSWVLLYFGLRAWITGHRVLFLSPELPKDEAEARFDALLFGAHDVPVDLDDLYRGYRPTEAQQKLAAEISSTANWVTMDSAAGQAFRLQEIPRLIRQHRPELVLIDGLSLLDSGARGGTQQSWEWVRQLSYGLKQVAVGTGVAIIVSHQANRSAYNTTRPPRLDEISFGDAFAQACDRVVVLSETRQPKQLRVTIQKFRKGEPVQGGIILHFEPKRGKIYELDSAEAGGDGDAGAAVGQSPGDAVDMPIP